MRVREWAGLALLCTIWGSTWAAIRLLVGDVPPLRAAAVRFAIAGIVALLWMLLRRKRMPRGTEWVHVLVLSGGLIAIPFGIIFWAEQTVASGTTALIYATVPIFTAFLTPALTRGDGVQAVPGRAMQAMIVGLGGIALLLQDAIHVSWRQMAGMVALLVAVALTAASTIYAKGTLAAKGSELHITMSSAWQFLFAAVWLGGLSLLLERGEPAHWSGEAIAAELFLSILGSVVSFTLYFWLLQRWEPYRLGVTQLLLPVVAVAEGALLLRERLQWQMVVAMVIIMGSVAFVIKARVQDEELVRMRVQE